MNTKTKVTMSIIAIVLSSVLLITFALLGNNTSTDNAIAANSRTIELSSSAIDVQSVFDEFENPTLTRDGDTIYFEGFKSLDGSALSEIDYISDSEIEELEACSVKYNFSYNSETNVVTLAAMAELPNGNIQVDEITGSGFLNENNEIDAVMNIDGEAILLSEMRDAGLIQNCGWFASLIKKVAVAVAVVAVAAVAVAAIVVTAGTAAPALVAAGIGVSTTVVASTVATAATIGTYAAITAAIASGVFITAAMWEQAYPGIQITVTQNQTRAKWDEKTKAAVRDIAIAEASKKQEDQKKYLSCIAGSCTPISVDLSTRYTCSEMAIKMRTLGFSSVTSLQEDALLVIQAAAIGNFQVIAEPGLTHYHAIDKSNPSYSPNRPIENNPRWQVLGYTIHSFWTA